MKAFEPTRTGRRGLVAASESSGQQDEEGRHHASTSAGDLVHLRWALTNWVTNGSAGSSSKARSVPRWTIRPSRIRRISSPNQAGLGEVMGDHHDGLLQRRKMARRSAWRSARTIGSRAPRGSSSRMIGGSSIRARIRLARCR